MSSLGQGLDPMGAVTLQTQSKAELMLVAQGTALGCLHMFLSNMYSSAKSYHEVDLKKMVL